MESIFNTPWLFSNAKTVLSFLFIMTLKSGIIISVAYVLTKTMRRAAAATRHLIWTMALVSILLLPIFSLLLPSWDVPLPNNFFSVSRLADPAISKPTAILNKVSLAKGSEIYHDVKPGIESSLVTENSEEGRLAGAGRTPGPGVSAENKSSWLSSFSLKQWPIFLLSVWILGTVVILGRHFAGRLFIWWVARKAPEINDDALQKLFGKLSARLGIRRPVKILQSPKTTMPMTWGILKPKILFPSESSKWSSDRRRFVLLHELAHVKRMDTLTQLLAQLVHAIYWMNPLIWVANRQLLKEREYACDDCVLSEGSKASEYANLLLEFARSLQVGRFSSLATVAMARRSQLEGRMLAILDPRLSRGVLTPLAVLLSSVAIFSLVLPLAAMRPAAETQFSEVLTEKIADPLPEEPGTSRQEIIMDDPENSIIGETETIEANILATSVTNHPSGKKSRNSNSNSTSNTNSNSNTDSGSNPNSDSNSNFESHFQSNTATYSKFKNKTKYKGHKKLNRNQSQDDSFVIKSLSEALKDVSLEVRIQAAKTLGDIGNPMAVKALMTALNDENWQMRQYVVHALGEIEDPAAVDALIAALKDEDWHVRSEAANALGEIQDSRAAAALGEALQDTNARVRNQAICALGELEDRSAIGPLSSALKDKDWQIRKQAARALGEIDDPSAVTPLITVLNDDNAEVRKTAIRALGEIDDRRAVQALIQTLKDEDWQIRKQSAWALGEIDDRSAVDALGAAITDPNREVRKTVVWALGEIEDPRAIAPLTKSLQDSDWEIRKQAAWALGEIEDPSTIQALSGILKDENREVRKTAAWALGEIDDYRAVQPLMVLLNDEDWEIRKMATWALGEIRDPAATQALSKTLKDRNVEVRKAGICALAEIKDQTTVPALIEALKDQDWDIRSKAAYALGELRDRRAMEPLTAALKDENANVRKAAARALGKLRWRD